MLPVFLERLGNYVKSATTDTSGTQLVNGRTVLKGLHFNDASGGTAGTVTLKDGGSGGDTLLVIHTPGQGSGEDVDIPGGGIIFTTDLYVELSNVDGVTVFYADK